MAHLRVLLLSALASACTAATRPAPAVPGSYFDAAGRDDALAGGVKRIAIETPKGTFHVWTKRVGNNPTLKVLLLHGGPGATHEYLEAFDSYFPAAGIEYFYYDQLGSAYSDQPDEPELWDTARFVEEVEQVRVGLGLERDDFVLYGHSWGGILAIEYALKYQQHLKALVVSNMMASVPAYAAYARDELLPRVAPEALAEMRAIEARGDFENPRYMELLVPNYYVEHILRMPAEAWPEPVTRAFAHLNQKVYLPMQGPSEMTAGGKLATWDRLADLARITVPTLVIGAQHDTMDPRHMREMASRFQRGRYLYCPNGSHMALYDDQQVYFAGLIQFLRDVDRGHFSP